MGAGLLLALGLLVPRPSRADAGSDRLFLRREVSYLASDELQGRRTGSAGAEAAARHLAAALAAAGARPMGEHGTFFQPFLVTTGVARGRHNRLVTEDGEMDARDLTPLSVSADGTACGGLVFAGYGISAPELGYDDYDGLDCAGRIVVVARHEPRDGAGACPWGRAAVRHAELAAKVWNAARHGAAALLLVNRPADTSEGPASLQGSIVFPDAGIPALQLSAQAADDLLRDRGLALSDTLAAIDADLCPRSRPLPGASVIVQAELVRTRVRGENVVASLGPVDAAEAVVVGAHYDHLGRGGAGSFAPEAGGRVHHGADDNASGTAAVLALARALAADGAQLSRRVILVLFSGEEQGLWGSRTYVDHPPFPLARTAAMINMDMVGRMEGSRLMVGGTGSGERWDALLRAGSPGLSLDLLCAADAGEPSDHEPFFDASVPVLFLFTGMHEDYHRPSDSADRINVDGLARVATLAERLTRALARGTRMAFRRPLPSPADDDVLAAMGFLHGAALGAALEPLRPSGVRLGTLAAGGAAERAGLATGDVVVAIDGDAVTEVAALRRLLSRRRAGDRITVEIERRGQRRAVPVILGRLV